MSSSLYLHCKKIAGRLFVVFRVLYLCRTSRIGPGSHNIKLQISKVAQLTSKVQRDNVSIRLYPIYMNNIVSKGMRAAVKPHQQNPSVLNRRCRLTQVGTYNGRKTVVVVVVHEQHEPRVETMMTVSLIMKFNKEEISVMS